MTFVLQLLPFHSLSPFQTGKTGTHVVSGANVDVVCASVEDAGGTEDVAVSGAPDTETNVRFVSAYGLQ